MKNQKIYKEKAKDLDETYSLVQREKTKLELKEEKFKNALKLKEYDL